MKSPSMRTFWVSNSDPFEYLFLMKKNNCNDIARQWATSAVKTEVSGWQVRRDGSMSQALLTKECDVIIYYFDGSSNHNKWV